ncbi:hypothetical protein G7Y79_00020g049180 [Physcia stellaris]|nr:hypothetical protein G7Y79_00020g049180 [Physcia stellaris]
MASRKRGTTIIGSNIAAQASTNGKPQPLPTPVRLCESKICTVKAPHQAKSYASTTRGLPKIIKDIEAKTNKSSSDRFCLDVFYTVHWDHVNRPLPTPTKECVHKACPVWARHEDKVFSKNPKKANLLPLKVQQVQAKAVKTKVEIQALINFWHIHGPQEKPVEGSPS